MDTQNVDRLNGDLAEEARGGLSRVKEFGKHVGEKAIHGGKAALGEVAARADDFSKDLSILAENGIDIVRQRVAHQPLTSLGIAAVAGMIIAGLVMRR